MEQLLRPETRSRLDRLGDHLGLSYSAAVALAIAMAVVVLAPQAVPSAFFARAACDLISVLVLAGVLCFLVRARRRSEARVHVRMRQMEIILEGAPTGIGMLDLERRVVYCNPEFARTYGFRQDEIRGVVLPMPDSQRDPWADLVGELCDGRSFVNIPALRERKDGTRFYATISGAPITDGSEAPFGLVAVITATKDNLDEPLQSRSMELLVQSTSDFICVADLQGRTLFVNETGIRMNGMRADEVEGTSLLDFFAVADRGMIGSAMGKAQEGGRLLRGEIGLRHFRTGGSLLALCKVFVIEDPLTGEPASIACVAQDISHRRMIEQQLQNARYGFETLLHRDDIGVALVNPKGHIIDSNETFQQMVGYGADEIRTVPFSTFVHPDDLPQGRKLFLDLVEGTIDHYQTNKRLVDRHGTTFPGRMTVRLMRDSDGRPSHTISIIERLSDGAGPDYALPQLQCRTCQ